MNGSLILFSFAGKILVQLKRYFDDDKSDRDHWTTLTNAKSLEKKKIKFQIYSLKTDIN